MGPKGDNNPAHATGPLPGKGVLDLSTITPTAFAALPTNRTSYVQEWNAQIQRELSSNTVAAPPPSVGGVFTRPGNLPRNFLTGPGTHTLDFSLFKNFNITERFKTEFRTEFYNLTNTPQFANPEANRAGWQGNFGKITNTRFASERQIQFALRISF